MISEQKASWEKHTPCKMMMMKEYCYDCAALVVEEYDPVSNWRVPEEFEIVFSSPKSAPVFAHVPPQHSAPPSSQPNQQDIEEMLKAVKAKEKLQNFLKYYTKDLFNASAVFILKQARLEVNRNNKTVAFNLLKSYQKDNFSITDKDIERVGRGRRNNDLVDAARRFMKDKDIFNLSPLWLLKIGNRKTQTVNDLIEAMYVIERAVDDRRR